MKRANIALLLSACALLTACGQEEQHPTSQVAVLDVRSIIQQSPVVAQINKKLTADIQPMKEALRSKQSSIESEMKQLNDPNLSSDDAEELKAKLIEGKKALITQAGELQKQSSLKQTEALKNIYGKLDNIIAKYNRSRQNQYKLILKKSYVLYTNENLNITSFIQHDFDKSNSA